MNDLPKPKKKTEDQWHNYIGTSLRKTAEATLDTARRVAEYRLAVEDDVFTKSMKGWFGFSPSHLSYWSKISEALPRFEGHTDILPSSSRTLYELSGLDDALWDELVETGDVNPSITVEGAKGLKVSGGFKKATASKYSEADNFLEIMQSLDQIMANADTIKDAKKELSKWVKANPPVYQEEEVIKVEPEEVEHEPKESTPEIKGTSSQVRVKCLALFGIYVDRPIIDDDILKLLDQLAGSDETLIAAVETLNNE